MGHIFGSWDHDLNGATYQRVVCEGNMLIALSVAVEFWGFWNVSGFSPS